MGFYQKLFASKYDSFMSGLEKQFFQMRNDLIFPLEGKILDVGSGTGVNFHHFNSETDVIAVEPSSFMMEKAKNKFPDKNHIKMYNLGVNDSELIEMIQPGSLDSVVCTLVLCTIPNPKEALQNFRKWLKPNGKLVVIEHIHAEKKVNRVLQNIVNPAWKVIGDGCNLNRDTDLMIKEVGFELEQEEYFKNTLRFYKAEFRNNKSL